LGNDFYILCCYVKVTRGSAFEIIRTVDGMRLMEMIRMECVAFCEVGLRGIGATVAKIAIVDYVPTKTDGGCRRNTVGKCSQVVWLLTPPSFLTNSIKLWLNKFLD
jgi:hypothetical protein